MRERGQGGLFKHPKSRFWIAKWYDSEGRPHSQSTRSEVKQEAEKVLRGLMADADKGVTTRPESIKYPQIREDLLTSYRNKGNKSLQVRADGSETINPLGALDDFFNYPDKAGPTVARITNRTAAAFIVARQAEDLSNATINNSLSLLRRMLKLAKKNYNLSFVASIDLMKPPPPRKGFLPLDDFNRLLGAMPTNLRPIICFLYYSGARIGETRKIRWDQVDLKQALIRFEAEQTKGDTARTIPLPDVLVEMLRRQPKKDGRVFDSSNLRKSWEKACDAVGMGKITQLEGKDYYLYSGLGVHDLRRSGVRNLRKAGIRESVAMKISGHKNRSVFDRYDIVDIEDVQNAMKQVEQAALSTVKTTRRLLAGKVSGKKLAVNGRTLVGVSA